MIKKIENGEGDVRAGFRSSTSDQSVPMSFDMRFRMSRSFRLSSAMSWCISTR